MDRQGLILCARYAAAPNFFGYCGPDKNKTIIDQLKEKTADKEMTYLLSEFETLYPYLSLIAYENGVKDPFDRMVVDAYWIGNHYLKKIPAGDCLSFFDERLQLTKKIGQKDYEKIKKKVFSYNFLPNHCFHVFNIFKRTVGLVSKHTLETIDNCKISFGQVTKFPENQKVKITNQGHKMKSKDRYITVRAKPLMSINNKLLFGKAVVKTISLAYREKIFIGELKPGDWVSFHWGMICDILTLKQVKNLEFYTQKAVEFYNLS